MECSKCGEELEVIQDDQCPVGDDKQDITFKCKNEHRYFTRIDKEDLMEDGE